jgi:hypothetical protein
MGGNDGITIAQGARIEIYSGGTYCKISGLGIINQSGNAANCVLRCTASVSSLDFDGNGQFIGVIAAPSADVHLNGGGYATNDYIGALIGNSITMNGSFNFHFDESLYQLPLFAPQIELQPTNPAALAGQNIVLAVGAKGSDSLRYQWRFNGGSLTDATNSTLVLSNLTASHAGQYSVLITNSAGSAESTAATLSVFASAAARLGTPWISSSNQIQFDMTGVPGLVYTVQASTNLLDWVSLVTNVSPFTFHDSASGNFSRRYYRSLYNP